MMRPLFALLGALAILLGWLGVIAVQTNGDPPAMVLSLADSAERCHLPWLAARGYLLAAQWERARLNAGGSDRDSAAGRALVQRIIATRMAAARLLLQEGYTQAAEQIALEGARADFDDLQARALLLEVRLRGERAEEARRELMALLLKQETPQLLCLLGSSFAREGNKEDAAGCYERALQLDGEHVPTLVAQAELQTGAGAANLLKKAAGAAATADERELVAAAQRRLAAGDTAVAEAASQWWLAHHISLLLVLAYVLFLASPGLRGLLRGRGEAPG